MSSSRSLEVKGKVNSWLSFSDDVVEHIDNYVIPQYGDEGDDIATDYTVEECVSNMKRYLARLGRNSRPGHDKLDCIKLAHYAQMIYDKLEEDNA